MADDRHLVRIINACPYLEQDEAKKIWNRAKAVARGRRLRGNAYWAVATRIAIAMGNKVNQERFEADEKEWREEFAKKQDGDW